MNHQLKVFIEVVNHKNFTRAAEVLHMTQPAVSQSIVSLETELGVRLIERTNKSVQLNKAGVIVYQYAKEILRNQEQMVRLVSDLKNNPSGDLKIGASYTIGEYVLPNILVQLKNIYPLISPHVVIGNTDEIGHQLLNHHIDIGLIEGNFSHHTLTNEVFARDEMYIIAGQGLNLQLNRPIAKSQLADQTWLIREEGSGTRLIVEQFLQTYKIVPSRLLTFGSTQIIKEAIESGIGLSLLSKWAIKKELRLGMVRKLSIVGTPVTRHFSIIKHKHDFLPKNVQAFIDIVKKSITFR